MGKVKSAILTVLYSVVLAVLFALCVMPTFTLSTSTTGAKQDFNSVLKVMKTDTALSGGYFMTYYPDGVIPAADYADLSAEEAADYTKHGSLYLSKDIVVNGEVDKEFEEKALSAIDTLCDRFRALDLSYLKIEAIDDYAVRVEIPSDVTSPAQFFAYMGVSGDFTLRNSVKSSPLLRATSLRGLNYYFKGVETKGGNFIAVNLTKEGRAEMKSITEKVSENESDQVLGFYVGETSVISLTTTSVIDQSTLYISGYSDEYVAKAVAAVLDSCVKGSAIEVDYMMGEFSSFEGAMGEKMPTVLYIGLGVTLLALAVFSVLRYRGFGAAHVYGLLSYFVVVVMCLSFIESITFTVGSVLAVLFGAVLSSVSVFYLFEKIKKEFLSGKRISASVKEGYKASLAGVIDVHAVLVLASVLVAFVPLGAGSAFGVALLTSVITSAAMSLLITPALAILLKGMAKDEYAFCNFKREVIDDED